MKQNLFCNRNISPHARPRQPLAASHVDVLGTGVQLALLFHAHHALLLAIILRLRAPSTRDVANVANEVILRKIAPKNLLVPKARQLRATCVVLRITSRSLASTSGVVMSPSPKRYVQLGTSRFTVMCVEEVITTDQSAGCTEAAFSRVEIPGPNGTWRSTLTLLVQIVRFPLALIIPSHHDRTSNSASKGRRMTLLKSMTVTMVKTLFGQRSTPRFRVATFGLGVQTSSLYLEDRMRLLKDPGACTTTPEV